MKRRTSRTSSSAAQLGLWDELESLPRTAPVNAAQPEPQRIEKSLPAPVSPRRAEAPRRAE